MAITYASNTITISGAFSSGTATSGSTTTLVDSSKSWSSMINRMVWIHTGTGAGTVAKILSNTGTVLTFDRTLSVALDSTSQYIVGHTFDDIWDADNSGSWGVVIKEGNQFSLSAKIVIGDGTTTNKAFLADVNKDIQFEDGTVGTFSGGNYWNNALIRYSDYSGLALGNVLNDANKTTHEGCTLRNLDTDICLLMGGADSDAAPSGNIVMLQLAGCQISGAGKSYRTIIASGDSVEQSIIWNTTLMNGVESSLYGTNVYNCSLYSGLYGLSRVTGTVDKLVLIGVGDAPLRTGTVGEVSATYKNVTLKGCGYFFYFNGDVTLDQYIINAETDTYSIRYNNNTAATTAKLWEQYELDITALKKSDESALSGVRIYIKDSTDTQVYNNTTDSNGEIPTQVLNRGYFTYANGQNRTARTPHTIKLRKYGFVFLEQGFQQRAKLIYHSTFLLMII